MKRAVAFLLLALCLSPCRPAMAGAPVHMSHAVEGYRLSDGGATLDLVLHVENLSGYALRSLTFTLVSSGLAAFEGGSVTVPLIEPYGAVDFAVSVSAPIVPGEQELAELPLFWTLTVIGEDGAEEEFSAESRCGEGGCAR